MLTATARPRLLGVLALVCFVAALALIPSAAEGQATRADSAAALLRAAQILDARGETRLARELLRVLAERFPESAGAQEGREVARRLDREGPLVGFNRAGFILYHTAFGAWLGVMVPAALGADGSEPYGAGLLIGAPLGFLGSRALAHAPRMTSGRAAILQFASTWGTWQGLGWQAAADIGVETICESDFCYDTSSDTAPWAMALAGGIAGFGAGLLAARSDLTEGQSAVISQFATWGSWYGLATGWITDMGDDATLTTGLIAGNIGLLVGIPAGRRWNPSASRVRAISAGGLAGGLAGLGVSLLVSLDESEAVAAAAAAGTTVGLIAGALLTRDRDDPAPIGRHGDAPPGALVSFRDGWSIGLPAPVPARIAAPAHSKRHTVPGVRVSVLSVEW